MCCQISITVLLENDDLKRFIIPEHSKNDVAYFVRIVRVHFSKTSKETMSDKIKRMLKNEIQQM